MTKTPQQIKNEVEKGCGERFVKWDNGYWYFICGGISKTNKFTGDEVTINPIPYCDKCQAKLSILTEYDKAMKEMIEDNLVLVERTIFIDNFKILNWRTYIKGREECWANKNPSIVIKKIKEELLSKIGDGSEVEK